jgi:hypothetical protein
MPAFVELLRTVSKSALTLSLAFGATSGAILAADLSQYRGFRFGTDLSSVAKHADVNPSQVKVIQRRPALMQELTWSPQPLGPSSRTEPAKEVVFSLYNGELSQIAVEYDRQETEGMTVEDFIDGISATYGPATKPAVPTAVALGEYGDKAERVARWEDPLYRFDLIRASYGPTFQLVGILKRLEAPAQAATMEAKRLDDQEAPQRDAARMADAQEAAKTRLEQARLLNKPKFRP